MAGFYSTAGWKALRTAQLRLEPTCRYCRQLGIVEPATVADHIEPHRGDRHLFYSRDNLQSLCETCHASVKQAFEKTGSLRGSDLAGLPLDGMHHWHAEGFCDER